MPSKPPSNQESEVDSAYEEKTSSRLTSKVGSPHSDRQDDQVSCRVNGAVGQASFSRSPSSEAPRIDVRRDHPSPRQKAGKCVDASSETRVPSIIRNASFLSEQFPVDLSVIPSLEVCSSNANSQRDKDMKGERHFSSNRRQQICDYASDSERPGCVYSKEDVGNHESGNSQRDKSMKGKCNFSANRGQQSSDSASDSERPGCVYNEDARNHESGNISERSVSSVKLGCVDQDFDVCISDIQPRRHHELSENPFYPSFSTISNESHSSATAKQEFLFLQGLPSSGLTSGLGATSRTAASEGNGVHSVGEIQSPAMESTRVTQYLPPTVSRLSATSTTDPSFVPLRGQNTQFSLITNAPLSDVEEHQG